MSVLGTLLIVMLVPLVVFARAYHINDVIVNVNGTNFATRVDATAHSHRAMTILSAAFVTEVHTCINPDGVRQDRSSYKLDYQAAVEQSMQIGPMTSGIEAMSFDDDHVTLPASQCPNNN